MDHTFTKREVQGAPNNRTRDIERVYPESVTWRSPDKNATHTEKVEGAHKGLVYLAELDTRRYMKIAVDLSLDTGSHRGVRLFLPKIDTMYILDLSTGSKNRRRILDNV